MAQLEDDAQQLEPATCTECGDDDAAEGWPLCLECLEGGWLPGQDPAQPPPAAP